MNVKVDKCSILRHCNSEVLVTDVCGSDNAEEYQLW